MIPTSANNKLRRFLEKQAEQEKLFQTPLPSYIKGQQPLGNDLVAHWRPEHVKEDIRELHQWLAEIDALPSPERDAAQVERKIIEARIADFVGDLFDQHEP